MGAHPPDEDLVHAGRRTDAAFSIEGVTCRAWVYEPAADAARPAPCIVMAHGLGGTRDASLEPYAQRFAASGFRVVLFDYRHLGASDGEPRQLVSIASQLEDWGAAIAFARSLPGVDAARIGLWGCSLSGGHVIVAAARDGRIGAVSAQCPMLDGAAAARMAIAATGPLMAGRMLAAALLDVANMMLGRRPHTIPLVAPNRGLAAMATQAAFDGCMAIVPAGWRNEVAARFVLALPFYRPLRRVREVHCPTLLFVCTRDTIVSAKAGVAAAQRLGDRARLVELPIDHFDVYRGEWLERSSKEQVDFFRKTLKTSA